MLREALLEHCSPTMAGIKTANMFTLTGDEGQILSEIRSLNEILVKKGLRLIPLRRSRGDTLIYLYRPERLREDLTYPEAEGILQKKGYPCGDPDRCIVELIRHLVSDEAFPHEIGLFLGYPPADVQGFMEHPSEGVRCVGCWKAYGNEREARKTFELYRKCKRIYCREASKGIPLERLIVDSRKSRRFRAANS